MNATIAGTGSCLGDKEYSNFDLWNSDLRIGGFNIGDLVRESFDTASWRKKLEETGNGTSLSDAEVFDKAVIQMSGIEKRRFSTTRGAEELGAEAATLALDAAGITAADLDYVFVGTFTGRKDIPTPAVSVNHSVASLIGAPEKAAVTHNETCSGFIYGMDLAYAKLQTGDCENILVVSTEQLSRVTNFRDYATSFLFGDGAGAAVLRADEKGGIICPAYVSSEYSKNSIIKLDGGLIQMKGGKDVVRNAVRKMVENSYIALLYHSFAEGAELKIGQSPVGSYKEIRDHFEELKGSYPLEDLLKGINWILPHQANGRIIAGVVEDMGYEEDASKFMGTIRKYANTSGGSIAITLDESVRDKTIKEGDMILITSLGGGYTLGALVFRYGDAKQ